jgi:hypothetical protein
MKYAVTFDFYDEDDHQTKYESSYYRCDDLSVCIAHVADRSFGQSALTRLAEAVREAALLKEDDMTFTERAFVDAAEALLNADQMMPRRKT